MRQKMCFFVFLFSLFIKCCLYNLSLFFQGKEGGGAWRGSRNFNIFLFNLFCLPSLFVLRFKFSCIFWHYGLISLRSLLSDYACIKTSDIQKVRQSIGQTDSQTVNRAVRQSIWQTDSQTVNRTVRQSIGKTHSQAVRQLKWQSDSQ